jgi:hypothetical protein
MNTHDGKTFSRLFDRNSCAVFADLVFNNCVFDNCALSLTTSPTLRSTVRNVRLKECVSVNCDIGPAVFEDVVVDGLETNDLLILWSPLFKHVTVKGKIGELKVNLRADTDWSPVIQEPLALARSAFYKSVDWALDISEAEFKEFDLHGIPARLVRRDPATQVIVTRERAMKEDWRRKLKSSNTYWPFVIDMFLDDGEPDIVLVAPKRKRKKDFAWLLDGLNDLRQVGVAEPD